MGMKLIITITYGLIEKQREEVRRLRTVWATWWPDLGQDPGLGRSWGTEQQHTVTLLVNRSTNDHNKCSKRQSSRLIVSLIRFDLVKNANMQQATIAKTPLNIISISASVHTWGRAVDVSLFCPCAARPRCCSACTWDWAPFQPGP